MHSHLDIAYDYDKHFIVLILVVMEDALAQEVKSLVVKFFNGLNPCCNGRCTRTVTQWLCCHHSYLS